MSMNEQDLTVQRNGLITLEVRAERTYVDDDRPAPAETGQGLARLG